MASHHPEKVAFIGLGAMGFGMASHLVKIGYDVTGFDVYPPSLAKFEDIGGKVSHTPKEAARCSNILVCMVANSQQADQVLFAQDTGAVQELPKNATIIICSTIPPGDLKKFRAKLDEARRSDVLLLDSPVSGGTLRAANGTLTILLSGSDVAIKGRQSLLSDLSENLYIIPGGIGSASNVKMINQLLAGVHIAAAAEAIGLAATMGLNTRQIYDVIGHSEANSWMFTNRVPHILENDETPYSALDIFVKDMGIVTASARNLKFPVPLSSAAEQLYILGSSQGIGRQDDSGLVKVFTPLTWKNVHSQAKTLSSSYLNGPPNHSAIDDLREVAIVGLNAATVKVAASLTTSGFKVFCFDPRGARDTLTIDNQIKLAGSAREAVLNAKVLIVAIEDTDDVEDILFGPEKISQILQPNTVVILDSKMPPSIVRSTSDRLLALGKKLAIVDVAAVAQTDSTKDCSSLLQILASGDKAALSKALPVLSSMTQSSKPPQRIEGGIGAASSVLLLIQLLSGIHTTAAAEAMALASNLGLDLESVYEIIKNAAGGSCAFEKHVPSILNTVGKSQKQRWSTFVDLAHVLNEAKSLKYPAILTAAAHQLYLTEGCSRWSYDSDKEAGERRNGQTISPSEIGQSSYTPLKYPSVPESDMLKSLPAPYAGDALQTIQSELRSNKVPLLIVLDDDPTGTQTCHDIAVLTAWDHDLLCRELQTNAAGFFILTNSRALVPSEAKKLIAIICKNLLRASKETQKEFRIVLRGDSTLRGHFPDEPIVVEESLGSSDAWILAPFFHKGGRYTISDVHYVSEKGILEPAGETQFAKDATFGYKSSNLRDYVLEKSGSRFKPENITSISLDDIRVGGPEKVAQRLIDVPAGDVVIVNAVVESDMHVFAAGVIAAEKSGKRYLCRTGADYVSARLGMNYKPPLSPLELDPSYGQSTTGGLIIAGSYVPKTTAQLKYLREHQGSELEVFELDVETLVKSDQQSDSIIRTVIRNTNEKLKAGRTVLVMTSRKLLTGTDATSSLSIGTVVADALVKVLQNVTVRPRYIISKGGITSSDAATKGLGMKRAMIIGQAAPGIPIWQCDDAIAHSGVPYIIFPGNVGSDQTLSDIVDQWKIHPAQP